MIRPPKMMSATQISKPTGDRVPRPARRRAREWLRLSAASASGDVFTPDAVDDLPPAARRWLRASITPGTRLADSVVLEMAGQIKLGTWRSFTASQVIRPGAGFVWAATARFGPISVSGSDSFDRGSGRMSWRALGFLPVMSAAGPDVSRSAADRLAAESVLVPTAYRRARWVPQSDPDRCRSIWHIGGRDRTVQLRVDDAGGLSEISMSRWGNPGGGPFGLHPFGVSVEEHARFAGVRIPSVIRAFWWWGTDREPEGEFFRAHITSATYR